MVLQNVKVYELAEKLEMSEPTLRARLKDGSFKYREMQTLIKVLHIDKPQDIFFKLNVSEDETEGVVQ